MIACVCTGLSLEALHELMHTNDYIDLADFIKNTRAGQQCGSCVPILIDVMKEHHQNNKS